LPPVGDASQYPKHIQTRIRRNQALGEQRLRSARAGYMGNLAFLDLCVGEVYKSLEELGLIDNTIVIYTSDHGEMDGDHGLWQKFVLYEPSVAVPLMVSFPKTIPQGKVSRALVEYMGIYPTLAELTGTGAPSGIDARSFAAAARNPAGRGPEAAFSEYDLGSQVPQYMIRTQRYKYIHNQGEIDELYDAEADPGELVNRAPDARLARTRNQLRDQLFAWYDPRRNPFRPTERAR
jgi:Arylsulfatase A and related enzymes